MSTLTTIAATDIISASRSVINANFTALNNDKVDIAGVYADPSWLTSISGAKVSGAITGNAATATKLATADVVVSRRSDGLLAVDNGTAIGTTAAHARDIMVRRNFLVEASSDPSAANLSIAGGNEQDVAAIYIKNDKLCIAYNRSGVVNYLTILLDGTTTTFTQSTTAP